MGIGGGINGENSGYIGVVTIVDYFSTLPHDTQGKVFSENSRKHRNCLPWALTGSLDKKPFRMKYEYSHGGITCEFEQHSGMISQQRCIR